MKDKLSSMSTETLILLLVIGLAAGTLSGMVGVGGGLIIVPALVFFMGFSQHQAQGTSLGMLLFPVGILGALNYYHKGYIDFKIVFIIAIGFLAGGWIGSKISLALPQETLKKFFAVILIYTAARLLGWDTALIKWIKSFS